jgi:hypothetical protein
MASSTPMIRPTPLTAALAGVFSALAWPLLWSKYGATAAAGGIELIIGTLLLVALPAHAFVMGFSRAQPAEAGKVDTALVRRVGSWLAASTVTLAAAWAWRMAS